MKLMCIILKNCDTIIKTDYLLFNIMEVDIMKKYNKCLLSFVSLGLITFSLALNSKNVSANTAKPDNFQDNTEQQNNTPYLNFDENIKSISSISDLTRSTVTGNVGISKVTRVSGRTFYIYIKMTDPKYTSFRLDLDLHAHYYNGKVRNISVVRGGLGYLNSAWTKQVTIPNVNNSHGYVVLTGRASSNILPVSAVVMEPTASF